MTADRPPRTPRRADGAAGQDSTTRGTSRRPGFGVGPSPLNPVKLEAALLLAAGLPLALASGGLLLPLAYGLAGAAWVAWRARRLARRAAGGGDG